MAKALKEFEVANYWLSSERTVPVDRAFFERMRFDAMAIIFWGD